MRACIQCVSQAQLSINQKPYSAIDKGLVILLGIGKDDSPVEAEKLWSKISKLRIFEDEQGKTNLSLDDIKGSVMIVSQFTLYAQCKKGNRPSFVEAAAPNTANNLYEYFISLAKRDVTHVATGKFGSLMDINLVNHGPFTLWLDTEKL